MKTLYMYFNSLGIIRFKPRTKSHLSTMQTFLHPQGMSWHLFNLTNYVTANSVQHKVAHIGLPLEWQLTYIKPSIRDSNAIGL